MKGQAIANTINTVTRVTVRKVYRSSRLPIEQGTSVELWTNSTCVCPELTKRKEYLIVGYEDLSTQRLLFLDSCLSVRWRDKLDKRIRVCHNFNIINTYVMINYVVGLQV